MKYIYFLKYNNYANRIFKRETNMSDYISNSYDSNYIRLITDCTMWNPNDGITTSITTPNNTDFSIEPDYLIAADEYNNIDSRWFVTETVRDRKGQYTCYLKRDVFADAWDELMDATCNIDRAIVSKYSKYIFNPEPISVNQIITDELEIKDKTGCPWIVFYGNDVPSVVSFNTQVNTYNLVTSDHEQWKTNNTYRYFPDDESDIQLSLSWKYSGGSNGNYLELMPGGVQGEDGGTTDYIINPNTYTPQVTNQGNIPYSSIYTEFLSYVNNTFSNTYKRSSEFAELDALNGKYLYDSSDGYYYQISVSSVPGDGSMILTPTAAGNLVDYGKWIVTNCTNIPSNQASYTEPIKTDFSMKYKYRQTVINLIRQANPSAVTAKVPTSGTKPFDSPYNMWCMPYGEISMTHNNVTVTSDKNINLAAAMAFSAANTSSKLYDFQILPFCPLPDEYIQNDGSIEVDDVSITDVNTMKDGSNNTVGYIFACPYCSFTRQILLETPITVDDPKLRNITDMWRLSSPNYASSFEFSVAKNDGLRGFNIRCTYMPINPYIRVAPIFGGLYGAFFEENVRGLICGGDYSMARIADAWVNYQEQNKNYQAIFNRTIDNMDVMHKYDQIENAIGAGTGAIAGTAIGAKAFGPVGMAVGGVGSAVAGVADYFIAEDKYSEQKSYTTRMHSLQLANVRALPTTLARTTAFNVDNRYFPVLTLYRCSSDEISAVANFIRNRSMTVGIIGNPSSYVNNTWTFAGVPARGFIQGSIINISSIHDTHFVDELNSEFQKGVYLR